MGLDSALPGHDAAFHEPSLLYPPEIYDQFKFREQVLDGIKSWAEEEGSFTEAEREFLSTRIDRLHHKSIDSDLGEGMNMMLALRGRDAVYQNMVMFTEPPIDRVNEVQLLGQGRDINLDESTLSFEFPTAPFDHNTKGKIHVTPINSRRFKKFTVELSVLEMKYVEIRQRYREHLLQATADSGSVAVTSFGETIRFSREELLNRPPELTPKDSRRSSPLISRSPAYVNLLREKTEARRQEIRNVINYIRLSMSP